MKKQLPIIRRSDAKIGYPAAEDDDQFLFTNFVDTENYNVAKDFDNPQFLIVGRTGTGKSATLLQIEKTHDNVVRINPKDLSFKYVSNSDLVTTYNKMGLNLEVVYEFLWRHILVVELLKAKFGLKDEAKTKSFLDNVVNSIRPQRKRAFEYLSI